MMRNPFSTLRRSLVSFWIPLLLLVTFFYATFAVATNAASGNEVNTDGKTGLEGHNEEEKFKGFFHHHKPIFFKKPIPSFPHKPIFKKPIPFVKPIYKPIPKPLQADQKPIPSVDQEAFLFKKHFFKKPVPIVKPIYVPIYKPIPKPVPVYKPIPVFKPIVKPVPIYKPIPVYKPIVKPVPIVKPIP